MAELVFLGLRVSVHRKDRQGRGPRGWGHRPHIVPGFLPILIVGIVVLFHNFSLKASET